MSMKDPASVSAGAAGKEAPPTTPEAASARPAARSQKVSAGDAARPGTRTFRLEFPAGMDLLNSNQRHHWRYRQRVTKTLRETGHWLARIHHLPRLNHAHVWGIYEPPDRRRRDPSNLYPSFKGAIDGIVDAGVLPDDDAKHLDGPDMRLGPIFPKGRLVLVIEGEVADA